MSANHMHFHQISLLTDKEGSLCNSSYVYVLHSVFDGEKDTSVHHSLEHPTNDMHVATSFS